MRNKERGASMVEYALLVALIAVVAIIGLNLVGNATADVFSEVAESLSGDVGGSEGTTPSPTTPTTPTTVPSTPGPTLPNGNPCPPNSQNPACK